MAWNWQLETWPHFQYNKDALVPLEANYRENLGMSIGYEQHLGEDSQNQLLIEVLSDEAVKTSEIEGEILDRASVQSSIRQQFGLGNDTLQAPPAEAGISEMMHNLHQTFAEPMSHEMLFRWHRMLVKGRQDLDAVGAYRTHTEAMRIVSGRIDQPKVHFEAPPSSKVFQEMELFINWINTSDSILTLEAAGIAHLWFESIHPFEDGNGRIGRAIVEKILSQRANKPTLIALSHIIEHKRNDYYESLERNSRGLEITPWLLFFSETILEAQNHTIKLVDFIVKKTQLYERVAGKLNPRQEKVIKRLFASGLEGFKGGLSARNYISIADTTRQTATRDLSELVELKALRKEGELKGTRYYLNI